MIEGVEIKLGGETLIVAPMNFKAIKRLAPVIQKIGGSGFRMEDFAEVQEVIAASLRRNHPDLTDDFLSENLDLGNVKPILEAVMLATGGKKTTEATKEGEE